jgi:SagB-type dehydrogenase family enzyme
VSSGGGDLPLKTSPSGGARHPVECYVVARAVRGLRPGIYHYAVDRHALERLGGPVSPARLASYYPSSGYFAKAPVHVFLTAVFARQLWRYPYSRAYRAALAEAGHVCQTFCLTATWLGLAPFCLMGLADSLIERDLGIDGISESVLYAAGVGRPPRGSTWAPTAPGVKATLTARPNPRLQS